MMKMKRRWIYFVTTLANFVLVLIFTNQGNAQRVSSVATKAAADTSVYKKWNAVSHLNILLNKELDKKAQFYLSEDRVFILILCSEYKDALVLNVKTGDINAFNRTDVTIKEDEFIALTNEQVQARFLTKFSQSKSVINFKVGNTDIQIVARAHLVGEATVDEIINHTLAYKQLMNRYVPSREAIEYLTNYDKPVSVTVAFGTWCPHCKKLVPTLMKSILECNNSNLNCSYFGINEKFNQPAEFLRNNIIKKIPTVIVRQGGIEIGRITGTPEVSMEDDLAAILKGTYSPKEN